MTGPTTTGTAALSLTVRYFAAAKAAAARPEEQLELPSGATLGDLVDRLAQQHGDALARVLALSSFLLDGVGGEPDEPLAGVRTVDVLPPFAGG